MNEFEQVSSLGHQMPLAEGVGTLYRRGGAAAVYRGRALYREEALSGFPLGLEKLENLEKWEGIFQSGKSQGILNRLEKSGKSQGKPHQILEN